MKLRPCGEFQSRMNLVMNRNVMSQGGEGKVERVFKYKMISVQNHLEKRKKKILHSDHFSLRQGPIVGGKLKREKKQRRAKRVKR